MTQNQQTLCAPLHAAFAPVVQKALASVEGIDTANIGTTRVDFVESGTLADIFVFVVPVKPDPVHEYLTALDIMRVAQALDTFSTYEKLDSELYVNDVKYVIGDGDDSLAVQFKNDEFKIWVRHFKGE